MNIIRWDNIKKCFYYMRDDGSPYGAQIIEFTIQHEDAKEFMIAMLSGLFQFKVAEKKKPMTIEEMNKRWPNLPPYICNNVDFWFIPEFGSKDISRKIDIDVNQDTINDLIDYLIAARDSMNN